MRKEEFDKKYVGDRKVVNCKTEEEACIFLKVANEFGYSWNSGNTYINNTGWGKYEEDTCYYLLHGGYGYSSKFKEKGKIILSVDDDIYDHILGITPRESIIRMRLSEIWHAKRRYKRCNLEIPKEWIVEEKSLFKELAEITGEMYSKDEED